ncbi:MAG: AzlD domain-containing protein [Erysipelotrichaceae bacterium]|nr:AzlD domain-containing protein [Erysipelotrichaceae bacterium]
MNSIWIGIACMASVTYLVRVLPVLMFRKPVQNRFVKSFLYYVPYAVLSAMTFPAIFAADVPLAACAAGTAAAVIASWNGKSLLFTACLAAGVVFAVQSLMMMI